jgi:hypothetical protein
LIVAQLFRQRPYELGDDHPVGIGRPVHQPARVALAGCPLVIVAPPSCHLP